MQTIKREEIYRLTVFILGLLLAAFSLGLIMPATANAAISVTITGDGITTPTTFTQTDLEAMTQVQSTYSTINTWPTKKWYVAEGVRLADLLALAGITDDAQMIKVTASDSYEMIFTVEELLDDTRYYYPGLKENDEFLGNIPGSPDGAIPVDTILALKNVEGSDNPDYMSGLNAPLLVMGQRYVTEQTNNAFVKYVRTIEVTTAAPGTWDSPAATPGSGTVAAGTQIALSTSDMDGDNLHYTTDGSNPDIDDPIYNWIKKRWWTSRTDDLATVNHPITVNQSMTIKTRAIGFGKSDSAIASFEYVVLMSTPPALTADTTDNTIGQAVDITFTDDAAWRAAITDVTINGDSIAGQYTVTAGNINIAAGVFTAAGDYTAVVKATGYSDTGVTQTMAAASLLTAPVLTADTTNNTVGQAIDITFTDDAAWRAAVTDVTINGDSIAGQYTVTAGNINVAAGAFTAAGDYTATVQAAGYTDTSVTQTMAAATLVTAPSLTADTTDNTVGVAVDITFVDDAVWRAAITDITIDGTSIAGQYSVTSGNINIAAGVFTAAGDYMAVIKASGYNDTSVVQKIVKSGGGVDVPVEDVVLTITGSGITREVSYTLSELQAMGQYRHVYSAINTWPTKKWYVGEGVRLKELLNAAGIKESAGLIKFVALDGYTITLTGEEILDDTRYYFPNFKSSGDDGDGHVPGSAAGAKSVEPILALLSAEGTNDPDYMNDLNSLLLMLGQRAVTEQNGNLFVKNLTEIEVLDEKPRQWDEPEADPDGGDVTAGTLVRLSNNNMDDDKIYYTTDGSKPTINSPMYNWIASRWWSSREDDLETINHPIEINEDTTIKAITIGPGREDSDVATFSYQVNETGTNAAQIITAGEEATISLGDEASVIIPADALQESGEVEVTINPISTPPPVPTGLQLIGSVYEFNVSGWDDYRFAGSVTITLSFDTSLIGTGQIPAIYYYDETLDQWINLGGSVSGSSLSVLVDHFTKFAVMVTREETPILVLTDIAGHWAMEAINQLIALGAVNGYPDGTFQPDQTITRAEFTTMLVKALKPESKQAGNFDDTTEHWAKEYIAAAAANGLVNGYDADTFGPDDLITREQMAVIIARAVPLSSIEAPSRFIDSASISDWAQAFVNKVVGNGIMHGYPDNTIQPQGITTRAEAVTVIVNAISFANK